MSFLKAWWQVLIVVAVGVAVIVGSGIALLGDDGGDPSWIVARSTSVPTDPGELAGSSWTLVAGAKGDSNVPIVDGWPVTLTFGSGTLTGTASCNDYLGEHSIDGQRITIHELLVTEAGCGDAPAASEAAFLARIDEVDTVEVTNGELLLSGGSTELLFAYEQPAPVDQLVGQLWLLDELFRGETSSNPVGGDPVTLLLRTDGTFAASTGCRNLSGRFVVIGPQVSFPDFGAEGDCPSRLWDQDNGVFSVLESGFTVEISDDAQRLTLTTAGNEGLRYHAITDDQLER